MRYASVISVLRFESDRLTMVGTKSFAAVLTVFMNGGMGLRRSKLSWTAILKLNVIDALEGEELLAEEERNWDQNKRR